MKNEFNDLNCSFALSSSKEFSSQNKQPMDQTYIVEHKPMRAYPKSLKLWLFIGLVMLFVQVIVGGVTRITGSGLSITKWEIVTGTIPPLNKADWDKEFNLYKDTPQYQEINEGMSLSDFKFIYFWEYIHRFWARIMGFVFLFPFLYFWYKGYLDKQLLRRLGIVIVLAGLAASLGWIMVASGLIERPWVNAYKLALHLSIAFAVYGFLFWTYCHTRFYQVSGVIATKKKWFICFFVLLMIQIFAGGVMSGMKAGVIYPTWPDIGGSIIPQIIFNSSEYTVDNFNYYDRNELLPALVHVIHRFIAYLVFLLGLYISYRWYRSSSNSRLRRASVLLTTMLVLQILLGIWTVISCVGRISLLQGVLHQAGALLLLSVVIYAYYLVVYRQNKISIV